MGFRYDYKPPGRRFSDLAKGIKIRKEAIVFVAAVILILIFYAVSASITGFGTYKKTVERTLNDTRNALLGTQAELNECDSSLFNTISEIDSCNAKLKDSAANLVSCEDERTELQKYSDELNVFYTTCRQERDDFRSKYEQASNDAAQKEEEFKNLVRNVVQGICCSFNDVQTGVSKNWDITTDKNIVCINDGAFTVNCGNGETDF